MLGESIAVLRDDPMIALILNNLRQEREEFVDDSTRAAWKLFERHPPKLSYRDLSGFVRRAWTVLKDLDAEIALELRASPADESNVEELHSLRKHYKRMRYTLEFLSSEKQTDQTITLLRKWQDVLGEIRDIDVRIDYLSKGQRA